MKIVFFGTPEPAAKILASLPARGVEIVGVVTQPDRPKGRGLKSAFSPVKELALQHKWPLSQPERVKSNPDFQAWLMNLKPDLAIVVAYGQILPQTVLDIPRHGFINLHASLLPKYRGAAPIQWALLKGEKVTGLTIFRLTAGLDTGPILAQQPVVIEDNDNAATLSARLFTAGEELLVKTLPAIADGRAPGEPQDEAAATYAPTLTKESGEIDWKKSAREIHDRIRGLYPWPAAHTFFHGQRLKLLVSELAGLDLSTAAHLPGTIVSLLKGEGFIVATGEGNILIKQLQLAAGKALKASDFSHGHDVKTGETLPN
ncbi:MAG: methionyl-tRNA formyltransferase [Candidatus Margulisiibacteriota bacterium]